MCVEIDLNYRLRALRNKIYYIAKPMLPRLIQIRLRQTLVSKQILRYADIWPVDHSANRRLNGGPSWPEKKQFALILTHDVDTERGYQCSGRLMELEKELGVRSSFNFVPRKYHVQSSFIGRLKDNGFEVGVHGLYHDGKLYQSKKTFLNRSLEINRYLSDWGAVGFRSPAMHHNLEWLKELNIEYDASTFDTDPFEPQSEGVMTVFPFTVRDPSERKSYIELPYTLAQDFTLFVLMKEQSINLWKKKLDWLVQVGGMVLVNTHPDYMNFENGLSRLGQFPVRLYQELIDYIQTRYAGQYWHVLPREIAAYWRAHQPMENIEIA